MITRVQYGTERFGKIYPMLADFFTHRTGQGMRINWHTGRLDWMLNHPYTDPALLDRIAVWQENGKAVAVVIFDGSAPPVYLLTAPGYDHLLPGMLDYAVETFGADCEFSVSPQDTALTALLTGRGYAPVGCTEQVLSLSCSADHPLSFALPEGYSISSLAEDWNAMLYERLLYKGFDHEGEMTTDPTWPAVPFA